MKEVNVIDVLNIIGSCASILSLVLTIWVAINLWKIRSHYEFIARVPQLGKKLERHATQISKCLNDYERFRPQSQIELVKAEVTLKTLKGKLPRQSRGSVIIVLNRIKAYDFQSGNKDGLQTIYRDMIKIAAEIKAIEEDLPWQK